MFLSIIKETFTDAAKLRQTFNLPILGTVSAVKTTAQRSMALASRSTFVSLTGALFFVYALLFLNIANISELGGISTPLLDNVVQRFGGILGI